MPYFKDNSPAHWERLKDLNEAYEQDYRDSDVTHSYTLTEVLEPVQTAYNFLSPLSTLIVYPLFIYIIFYKLGFKKQLLSKDYRFLVSFVMSFIFPFPLHVVTGGIAYYNVVTSIAKNK
jgi:hypothetical protein